MSEESISLIASMLTERAIGASVACMEARLRFAADVNNKDALRACEEASLAEIAAIRAQNEFDILIGRGG